MQQQLQEREASFSLLNKAHVLYNTWNKIQSKSVNYLQSIDNLISQRNATLEHISTLERHQVDQNELIYKQTVSIEKQIKNLNGTLELFDKVSNDWTQLEAAAARHITKSQPAPSQPLPLSTQSLIQVTAIKPTEVYDMIAQLASMYREEYNYKAILLSTLSQHVVSADQFQHLLDRWTAESRIDHTLMPTIVERIQLHKQIKKVLESV